MSIETLAEARDAGVRITARRACGRQEAMKRIGGVRRACGSTCTRSSGRAAALSRFPRWRPV